MNLSSVFAAVLHKQLVAVDLPGRASNQHELNGVSAFREFFGTSGPIRGKLRWHYFADDSDPVSEEGDFTFYDARARSAARTGRSEWRFYYRGGFLERAAVGDWFVLVRSREGAFFGLVFQSGSGWCRAAKELFGEASPTEVFESIAANKLDELQLALVRRQILQELNLPIEVPVLVSDEELVSSTFGDRFPTTKEMSAFSRRHSSVDPRDVDSALVGWLDREEQLFRALEGIQIKARLQRGFVSVDDFIGYSLSVQNRRKSRMGHALQNHLTEVFTRQGLRYCAQAKTEGSNRPDFLFPGQNEYHSAAFPSDLLLMLGVKSTSKDRWRQVLAEADRISEKHLCTLEAGISEKQTAEMQRKRLTLVLPQGLHATYTTGQLRHILSISEFVELARRKQSGR